MGVFGPLDHDEVADALGWVGELRHRAQRRRRHRRQAALTGTVTVFAALIAVVVAVTAGGSPASVSVTGPPHAGRLGRMVPVRKLVAVQMLSRRVGVGVVASFSTVDAASGRSARGVLQLAVTDDGARSWRLSGAPVPSAARPFSPNPVLPGGGMIAFATTAVGYLQDSNGLYETTDEGQTWSLVPTARYGPAGSRPTSVVATGDRVWVLSCPGLACRHPTVAVTTAGSARWARHAAPAAGFNGPPVGSTVTVSSGTDEAATTPTWRSTDGGTTWAKVATPCDGPVIVASPQVLFAVCGLNNFSRTGRLANTATVYRSGDTGGRWRSWATFRQTYTGMGAQPRWAPLAAPPQGNILYFTQNIWDGQLRALTPGATALTSPAKVGLVYGIDQLSAQDAWLLAPAQGIWATNNAGHSWNLITNSATSSGRSPANSTARKHPNRALPECQADQLSLTMPFRDPSAEWFLSGPPGGSRIVLSLHLTNTSALPCALGRSTVALLGPHPGSTLKVSSAQFASGLPTSADISVKPGDYAQLLLATWFPSTCSSRAISISISFPSWSTPITRTLPPPDNNGGYRGFSSCSGSLSVSWPLRSSDTNPFGQLRPPVQTSGASGPSDPTGVSGSPGLSTTKVG